ncbi:MAG: FtsW/RodA/SpoVE family cell cycle protein [Bacilli bacterium]|nr:FtsW/RodA/SpoVE family cell cycle protein [Bacilli bacterium]
MKNKKVILILVFCLMLFSLINNYSARYILSSYDNYFIKQLVWYLVSFLSIFILFKINIDVLFKKSFYLYILGNLLLLLTIFIGTTVNGSTSWIVVGPFSFQASEFMKIALILYLSMISTKDISDFKYIIITLIIVLIPSILTFLEPDTGAVMIYFVIYIAFLIMRKLNKWWYITVIGVSLISVSLFFVLYYYYQDIFINIFGTSFFYRMDRITDFVKGDGYQLNKALVSIGSSGMFGRGLRNIPEYFPEAPTDFAFALLINNIGYIGIVLFIFIYSLLIYNIIKIINKQNKLFVFPVVFLLLFQFTVNILMNIGLFPVIGITLPFISYGGSNLLSYMIIIGLILNIKKVSFDT